MMKGIILCCVVLAVSTAACMHRPCRNGTPTLGPSPCTPPADSREVARRALVEWLECEECTEAQLRAVTRSGDTLILLLRAAVLEGPSRATEELLRESLGRRYDEIRAYAATHPYSDIPGSKDQFIAVNMSNLRAQYQVRAGMVLAKVGGPVARQ